MRQIPSTLISFLLISLCLSLSSIPFFLSSLITLSICHLYNAKLLEYLIVAYLVVLIVLSSLPPFLFIFPITAFLSLYLYLVLSFFPSVFRHFHFKYISFSCQLLKGSVCLPLPGFASRSSFPSLSLSLSLYFSLSLSQAISLASKSFVNKTLTPMMTRPVFLTASVPVCDTFLYIACISISFLSPKLSLFLFSFSTTAKESLARANRISVCEEGSFLFLGPNDIEDRND